MNNEFVIIPSNNRSFSWVSGRIEPTVELIFCSHRMVYTNQTPIETERSEATIPRRSWGDAKRQTPRVTAWLLWPVALNDLVPFSCCLCTVVKCTVLYSTVLEAASQTTAVQEAPPLAPQCWVPSWKSSLHSGGWK